MSHLVRVEVVYASESESEHSLPRAELQSMDLIAASTDSLLLLKFWVQESLSGCKHLMLHKPYAPQPLGRLAMLSCISMFWAWSSISILLAIAAFTRMQDSMPLFMPVAVLSAMPMQAHLGCVSQNDSGCGLMLQTSIIKHN